MRSPIATAYRDSPFPDAATPWRDAQFCVIDLETTGLDPGRDEIVSFAALGVSAGVVRTDDARYKLIRPQRMPEEETILVHGLRSVDLEGAPPLADALDDLLEPLAGRILVAHVAPIERAFLGAALGRHDLELRNPMVDTAVLAAALGRRRGEGRPSSMGLTELAESFGLPAHRPHHAEGDALTTAQLFLALATHLDALEPQTVGSLVGAEKGSGGGPVRRAFRGLFRRRI